MYHPIIVWQTPYTGHFLHVVCPKQYWEQTQERLSGHGYKINGEVNWREPLDSHEPVAVSHWYRYDRPTDSWWDWSCVTGKQVLKWLKRGHTQPESTAEKSRSSTL